MNCPDCGKKRGTKNPCAYEVLEEMTWILQGLIAGTYMRKLMRKMKEPKNQGKAKNEQKNVLR
jgi:hypothetical protein